MRFRRGLVRQILIAIIFVIAVAIPVYFISDAYLAREDLTILARLDSTKTSTPTPTHTHTPVFPPTWTPRPSATPSETATPTPSLTPTEIFIPTTGFDFSDAFIKSVVHIPEGGGDTMVTIVVSGSLVGDFFAEVRIELDRWDYQCVIKEWSEDHLFCFGDRLPGTQEAIIRVYENLVDGETVKVFESEFEVSEFVPTNTYTPIPPRATVTDTPTPTYTLVPTNTPTPTATVGPPPTEPWSPTDTPEP